ncbi:MAG: hypothetical protein ABR616_15430, partial [Dermatophilaceae bacterium]
WHAPVPVLCITPHFQPEHAIEVTLGDVTKTLTPTEAAEAGARLTHLAEGPYECEMRGCRQYADDLDNLCTYHRTGDLT